MSIPVLPFGQPVPKSHDPPSDDDGALADALDLGACCVLAARKKLKRGRSFERFYW